MNLNSLLQVALYLPPYSIKDLDVASVVPAVWDRELQRLERRVVHLVWGFLMSEVPLYSENLSTLELESAHTG